MIQINPDSRFVWFYKATVCAAVFIVFLVGLLTLRYPNSYDLQEAFRYGLILFIPILILLFVMSIFKREQPIKSSRYYYLGLAIIQSMQTYYFVKVHFGTEVNKINWISAGTLIFALFVISIIASLWTFFTFKKEQTNV